MVLGIAIALTQIEHALEKWVPIASLLGVMALGGKTLECGERMTLYRFKELRETLGLPRVGERVRSKRFGSVWKVIEKKEVWLQKPDSGKPEENRQVPAIYLRYWREDTSKGPGTGKTMAHRYSQDDPSFNEYWEILYDW